MRYIRPIAILALVGAAVPARAQDRALRAGPQMVSFKITGLPGANNTTYEKTISEIGIPMTFVYTLGDHLSLDVGTAYAMAKLKRDSTESSLAGFTDTQVRAVYTLGNDNVVLTAGLNLPTGQTTIPEERIEVAGALASELFAFPISSLGSGMASTGGIAVARPFGVWALGIGFAVRHSLPYDPFSIRDSTNGPLIPRRFEPGNEYRVRFGLERDVSRGRANMGLTYSKFGDDLSGTTVFSNGDLIVGQIGYGVPIGPVQLQMSSWNVTRLTGLRAGEKAPFENTFNASIAAGFTWAGVFLEPNADWRLWAVDADRAGSMTILTLRSRFNAMGMSASPSAGYQMGSLVVARNQDAEVTGWQAGLTLRYGF